MQFETIFDVSREGFAAYSSSACGLVFVGLAALIVFRPDLMSRIAPPGGLQGRARTIFGYVALGLTVFLTIGSVLATYQHQKRFMHAMASGQAKTVEGAVALFHPDPTGGHGSESFWVANARFAYSNAVETGAFHREGAVHEGERVRITYLDGKILKLEVARAQPR